MPTHAHVYLCALHCILQVKNLRSSVARAAIACLGDIFIYAGRYMDPVSDSHTSNVDVHCMMLN